MNIPTWMAALLLCLAIGASGCRTRLWDLDLDGALTADGAAPDLSVPRDLTFLPDLLPPPDLTPPHYCDGIYVFQEDRWLAFFDPKQLQFHPIARLACPVVGNGSPFSMAVDRLGMAWVEYSDGTLYTVDTTTGACATTKFLPGQSGFTNFGMGFAADAPNSPSETLYLAGSDILKPGSAMELGRIDTQSLKVTPIGSLNGNAELTGTGAGDLWGFFTSAPAHYGRIDKMTAQLNPDIPVTQQLGDVSQDAFAFGFFGGVFYVFLSPPRASTTVYRLDPADQTVTAVLNNTGRVVVGAGVSTCAPQH